MKKLNLFTGKTTNDVPIAILGYGAEGQAIVQLLTKAGYTNITICDKQNDLLKKLPKKIKTQLGDHYLANLAHFRIIFRSPGIPYLTAEIQEARKNGVLISSATKLIFDHAPCPIIGITGTKGKGTTTSLIFQMLKQGGKEAFLGGNIGEPAIKFLDRLREKSFLVLELSSFQLQDLTKSPHIAVVLNITTEHLDHHASVEEYHDAKKSITAFQKESDYAVVNQNYYGSLQFGEKTPAHILTVSARQPVDEGAYVQSDVIYTKISSIDEGIMSSTKKTDRLQPVTLCHIRDIALKGRHNMENILPAVTVATLLGCPRKAILETLKTFKGLPHRLEYICVQQGIIFYNDSAATTPEATVAAIQSFATPLILIAGGSEKFSDFTELGRALVQARHLKTLILIGNTAKRIEQAIEDANREATEQIEYLKQTGQHLKALSIMRDFPLSIVHAKNIQEAFLSVKIQAQKGDTVLLSPACASFGEFKNYKHRGETFSKLASDF